MNEAPCLYRCCEYTQDSPVYADFEFILLYIWSAATCLCLRAKRAAATATGRCCWSWRCICVCVSALTLLLGTHTDGHSVLRQHYTDSTYKASGAHRRVRRSLPAPHPPRHTKQYPVCIKAHNKATRWPLQAEAASCKNVGWRASEHACKPRLASRTHQANLQEGETASYGCRWPGRLCKMDLYT